MNKLIITAIALLTVACASSPPIVYKQDGQSTYSSSKDRLDCKKMAYEEMELYPTPFVDIRVEQLVNDCMEGLGYVHN
jgi:hypothetical protein